MQRSPICTVLKQEFVYIVLAFFTELLRSFRFHLLQNNIVEVYM
jgi:hypothetical protein